MRVKQVVVTNGLIFAAFVIFFTIISVFTVAFAQYSLVVGLLMLLRGGLGLINGDSPRSFIPIFEQVAIYEKQKMGREWYKQRKVGYVWNLILGGLIFLEFYWNRTSTDVFQIDLMFMIIMTLFTLVLINISLIFHFRKVDRSSSELELKGYTWKSNLIGVVIGVVVGVAMIIITIYYLISGD